MEIRFFTISFVLLFFCFSSYPQQHPNNISILFYNVENLFDTKNNPLTNDNEFTPEGDRHWTKYRLNEKLLNISKAIINASGWSTPDIVALCEVENRYVLEKLVTETPLKNSSYKIIHKESPDPRGIDVALLYNSGRINPIEYSLYPLTNGNVKMKTREILYFEFETEEMDTIHFFVNHWPSRYDGLLETESKRFIAAKVLRDQVELLQKEYSKPKIVILGDFNDQPENQSLAEVFGVKQIGVKIVPDELYNLSFDWKEKKSGTIKYQSNWSVFDQIIVSGRLLETDSGFYTSIDKANIADLPFLLENDERYGGLKPKRSYSGFSYKGGFSDHLPVLLKLVLAD